MAWSDRVTSQEAQRRAAGRRRYNAQRQAAAAVRQAEVLRLRDEYGATRRGTLARIARELGVSRSTITRDVQWPRQLEAAWLRTMLRR